MNVSALILAASLLSCGREVISCEVATLTEFQGTEIRRAMSRWTAVSGVTLVAVERGDWLVVMAPTGMSQPGLTQRRRQLVRIDPRTPDGQVYPIALHELGHVLDLRHTCVSADPGVVGEVANDRPCDPYRSFGVMDPAHLDTVIGADDLAECAEAGSC